MAAPRKKRVDEEMVDLELGERGEADGSSDVDEEDMDDYEESSEEIVKEVNPNSFPTCMQQVYYDWAWAWAQAHELRVTH